MSVRPSPTVTSPSISTVHSMMFLTIQTIYFLKAYHLVTTLTETKTYKNINTNTKTKAHRQRQIQSAPKTQCMLYFLKSRGFKDIKYGISSQKNPPKIVGQTFSTNNSFGVGFDLVEA